VIALAIALQIRQAAGLARIFPGLAG